MNPFLPHPLPATHHSQKSKGGFSLVEVVIALAIAATGFVTLLGLLPQGMEMSRNASAMAAKTRIVGLVSGELASTPWSKITWTGHGNTPGARRYFDDQGIEIKSTDINENSFITYVVSIYVPPHELGPTTVKLPVSADVVTEKFVRRLQLYIANTGDQGFNFPTIDAGTPVPRNLQIQTILIPEMGIP